MAEELKMYTKYVDGKPRSYLYGPPWKAMELYMEGGYPTPEEAKAAWEFENCMLYTEMCPNCGEKRSYRLDRRQTKMRVRDIEFTCAEYVTNCVVCGKEIYVPTVNDMNVSIRKHAYEEAIK
jgi:hypothetical protein